ncbi:putative PLP-dependent enzyme possibly involved in cell wall biogenesis [Marinitoga piezophila KA3]|uniref:Putative PLP-dependent enzyme possibly involved in cell wall biogenesis n=1 Tax=Marinitoga piezophila (strain DSM 14283 / JCM 11233 / KA3) TaxID=443254 RepID=H2J2X0_MARPK|nr:LegC family aminotransferase [Marinitoga piezophila]AEX85661.1 putative PLP-dependent enzyme possibly involved in cell wall biogenesis [Marinitoga piezophila KA3]
MKNEILLDAPNLGELEKEYLIKCIDSTFVSTAGPFIPEFEEKFAKYVGTKRAVSVQSGTAALYMALYELGIGPGDEVIVPVITFIASVNPIMYLGATPVFVDVDPETWNIDPKEVEKAITKNTKAIIPVHLYGNPCDMDGLMYISKKYGIPIIEDATESLGATYNGKMTGTFGILNAFSFNGNKIMTTGGGGMITTNDEEKAEHIKFLINQARDASRGYYHPEIGFNYRMTNLEASLGLAQLERLEEFLNKKRRFAKIYMENLQDVKEIKFQKEYENAESSWWLTSIKINSDKSISEIQSELKEKGIPTRRIFVPIVEFPPYQKFKTSNYKNAYEIYERGLNLPSSTVNGYDSIKFVAEELKNVI